MRLVYGRQASGIRCACYYWRIATPERKFPGFAGSTSTTLNISRLRATWITNSQPQDGPQDKFALPLPSGFTVWTTKAMPVLTPSPQPEVCEWLVAMPEPFASSVKVTRNEDQPQPVLPIRLTLQGPASWAIVTGTRSEVWAPAVVAGGTPEMTIARASTAAKAMAAKNRCFIG